MLTQSSTITQSATVPANLDRSAGQFDALVGLPPADTTLGSEYFSEYLRTVASTGKTPF